MPVSYSTYPQGLDLQDFLLGTGLITATVQAALATTNWQALVDAAREELESDCGRLLLGVNQARVYDPPTNPRAILDLKADLVSVTSVTSGGVALVQNTDYWLKPYNSAGEGDPYKRIEFNLRWSEPLSTGQRRSIVITGLWGFGTLLFADAWNGILARGAWKLVPVLQGQISGGLTSRAAGDEREDYVRGGDSGLTVMAKLWESQYQQAVDTYKKIEAGL